jgi:exopolyphosphatase / guanosine-5'-triphosphate,3'-diphosphate pyrophosphatase
MAAKHFGPVGIIDIGSNSVRFVAYGGAARVPSHLFNEKVSPALGRGIARDGRLDEDSVARALTALARYDRLARDMGLKTVHTVATAAVREASNGAEFLKQVAAIGLKPRILSGEEEAELSGLGVLSAIPDARGVVADLGGGSLELIPVKGGKLGAGLSLPLGVLRVGDEPSRKAIAAVIRKGIAGTALDASLGNSSLYLVGGSFRALARLDLHELGHPLPIVHSHRLTSDRVATLERIIATTSPAELKERSGLSSNRLGALPAATAILDAMLDILAPGDVIVSSFGLREGLLYRALDAATRAKDPLIAAALEVGDRLGRFGDHGAAIDAWIDPLFPDDDPPARRLRLAACLMSDFAWNAHPDFRAERAVDLALHGNWVGIDAHGRAVLGRTLCAAFGGDKAFDPRVSALLDAREEERCGAWGRAIRLAQRLSAGTEATLRRTSLALNGGSMLLRLPKRHAALVGESVEQRLKQLAKALGRSAEVEID